MKDLEAGIESGSLGKYSRLGKGIVWIRQQVGKERCRVLENKENLVVCWRIKSRKTGDLDPHP